MILTILGIFLIIIGIYGIVKGNYNTLKKLPVINIINGITLVLFGVYCALYQYLKYSNWTMIIVPIILIFTNIILKTYLIGK